jgi:predicted MFS family arabinose efflux permease
MVYMLMDMKLDKQVEQTDLNKSNEKFKFKDILGLLGNPAYLFIALICVTFYSAVFPFNAFAPDFLYHSFGMSYEASGQIASLLPLGTLVFTPLFGFMIDRYGRAASAMILGSLVLLLVHLSFTFTGIYPHIPMILLGVAFSLVPAAMWPSMVKLVEDKQIGTAYGLMYSIQNLGLWGYRCWREKFWMLQMIRAPRS